MISKINIVKLIDKYPKLMKSSVTLQFLKNYYKDIQEICNENPNEIMQKSFAREKILKVKTIMDNVTKMVKNLQQMLQNF